MENNIVKNEESKPPLRKIIHNIRNMLELTDEEKEFIKTCSENDKIELIFEYDKVLNGLVKIMYANL
jgi:hypothetical protein